MIPYLRAAGCEPVILFEPETACEEPDLAELEALVAKTPVDIVYFQKVHGPSAVESARALGRRGIPTVYGVCDFVDNGMAFATSATITVTPYLKTLYAAELQERIYVVHDSIEQPNIMKRVWRGDRGSRMRPLRAVLVSGHEVGPLPMLKQIPGYIQVIVVGNYPVVDSPLAKGRHNWRKLRRLRTNQERTRFIQFLFNRRVTTVGWTLERAHQLMVDADLGIIPVDTAHNPDCVAFPAWKTKSENRLTMKMSAGLPVIAAPVPSYLPVIQHGVNGFVAETADEWDRCLDLLRDPALRRMIGERARDSVIGPYSQEAQAARLISVLDRVSSGLLSSTKPGAR